METNIDKEKIKAKFTELQGKIKKQYGKLTDDEIKLLDGKKDEFVGKLQQKYDISAEEAKAKADEFVKDLS